jgi:fatty acid desaturase
MTRALDSTLVQTPAGNTASAAAYPIPARLNLVLVALVFSAAVGLLTWASRVESWGALLAIGVAYSYLLLTNYALLHEATHDNLHPSPRGNDILGVIAGTLFPIPFSLIHSTHQNHHARNRTDSEMFDLYYASDNRLRKFVQWYGILLGLFWPIVPVGALLFAFGPRALRRTVTRGTRATGGYVLAEPDDRHVRAIRVETILIIAFFAAGIGLLGWTWQALLVCYACFSSNWSTRQYIGHAFAKRHVIDGAWNLRHFPWMSWLLLHGEYDLNHHRRPDVPWLHLPKLSKPDDPRIGYLRQYWRQWRGPRPNVEAAPEPLVPSPLPGAGEG